MYIIHSFMQHTVYSIWSGYAWIYKYIYVYRLCTTSFFIYYIHVYTFHEWSHADIYIYKYVNTYRIHVYIYIYTENNCTHNVTFFQSPCACAANALSAGLSPGSKKRLEAWWSEQIIGETKSIQRNIRRRKHTDAIPVHRCVARVVHN